MLMLELYPEEPADYLALGAHALICIVNLFVFERNEQLVFHQIGRRTLVFTAGKGRLISRAQSVSIS